MIDLISTLNCTPIRLKVVVFFWVDDKKCPHISGKIMVYALDSLKEDEEEGKKNTSFRCAITC